MSFTQSTIDKLRSTVETACADPHTDIPGATVVVVGKDGTELFAHSAGRRGLASSSSDDKMTLDSAFWIASCTKAVTGIACMQLVEQGVLRLDDGAQIEGLCPELKALRVLRKDGAWEEKKTSITLRMLLTHTAGFGYSFGNERLRDSNGPAGCDEFSGRREDMIQPLLFQPGEGWEYGIGVDWAGIALERVTGLTLGDYMKKNIFEPLHIQDVAFVPSTEMKAKLAYMHQRLPNGVLHPRNHILRPPLVITSDEELASFHQSGGGGLFARPQEYCKILATLLNGGQSPTTGASILKPATVADMFTNQIPQFPDFARQGMPAAKPDLVYAAPECYPVADNAPQGWGLTFMLSNGGPTGRSKSTVHWAGLANCYWWCDPENNVAGMIATQIVPLADLPVLKLWFDVETEVYTALGAAAAAAKAGD